ncbi:MAG TPA: hypothetical protein VII27_06105 [Thermoplasmata archaeon]
MTLRALLVLGVLLALAIAPAVPVRGATDVTGIVNLVADYVNGSLAEMTAVVIFNGSSSGLSPVRFDWYAPDGSLAFQEIVPPDVVGFAWSRLNLTVEGTWALNATYTGTPAVWDNQTFRVLPVAWGPGLVDLARSTRVGRFGALAIAPGTTVRLPRGAGLGVAGAILARGTSAQRIAFTSSAASPAAGDWDSILFAPQGGALSRLENASVSFATGGIEVYGATPALANLTLVDSVYGMKVDTAPIALRDSRFERDAVAFSAIGFGGALANVTIAACPTGLSLLSSSGGRFERLAIAGSTTVAVYGDGGAYRIENSTIQNSTAGLLQVAGDAILERVSVLRGTDGLRARDTGRITAWNATVADPTGLHASATTGGTVTLVNATLSVSERLFADAASRVVVRNFLRVRVLDYDRNATVAGAIVRVFDNDREVAVLTTDGNGTTPRAAVTDRILSGSLRQNATRVLVAGGGLLFGQNNRTVDMATSHTETFRGSTRDNDRDGEPDFSDPDDDNDGLLDSVEGALGTDPLNADSDGDGMPDGWEFQYQRLPRDPTDAGADPDGDGLTNLQEYRNGTDPRSADSDGDRMPDGWELGSGLDPTNASDASQDADGDGFSNLEEFRGGTDPRDPGSHPTLPLDLQNSWLWTALAVVLATAILALSVVLLRRRRRAPPEEPGDGTGGD